MHIFQKCSILHSQEENRDIVGTDINVLKSCFLTVKSESGVLALPINLLKMQNLSCQLRPSESQPVVSKDPKELYIYKKMKES